MWPKKPGSHGYGQVSWQGPDGRSRTAVAHRLIWWHSVGPIPDGLTVQHTCHNRLCLNVAHMEIWANARNATDNLQGDKTHCPAGHPYSGDNLYINRRGHRQCRQCARDRKMAISSANRAAGCIPMHERTHCPHGHPYTEETTYLNPKTGHRSCKVCRDQRNIARKKASR